MDAITGYQIIIYILVSGILFTWLFRRIGLIDVVGYIAGGIVLAIIMNLAGFDITVSIPYIELIAWIGLVLFSFRVGAAIGFRSLSPFLHRLIATELIVALVQWIFCSIIAFIFRLDFMSRVILFLFFINSSSIAVLALEKLDINIDTNTKNIAYIQTQLEDLIQFIVFSMITAGGVGILQPMQLLIQITKVSGLVVLLLYLSKYMLKWLSRSPLTLSKENKFFISIAITLIFTSIATLIGLPSLLGAFIAGLVSSLYLDLSDITDRLDGLKDLGLLLYFSSLGFQLYLGIKNIENIHILAINGIVLGLIAFLSRFIGLFTGLILSGNRLDVSFSISIILTPLSEVGIMFIDMLIKQGLASIHILYILMLSLLTSLITFSTIIPKTVSQAMKITKIFPSKIVQAIDIVSQEYTKRLSAISSTLFKVIIFTSIALFISYIDAFIKSIVINLNLPVLISALSTLGSVTAILISFIEIMRRILKPLMSVTTVKHSYNIIRKLFDIIIGGLAIALQIQILHEFISRYSPVEPLYLGIVIAVLIVIAITIRDIVSYLRKR